jgi:hypothetical protein
VRHEVARLRVDLLLTGGSADVESVIPGLCSKPVPTLMCVAGDEPEGCEARGRSPRAAVPSGGYRRGEGRTGELREPPLMPRESSPRRWDAVTGCRDWPLGSGRRRLKTSGQPGEHRRPRGRGGTQPGRSSYVWNVVTPSGSGVVGKPTVRKAEFPGGYRMTEKRMPVAERQQETGACGWRLQLAAPDNWPDTGLGGPARKGADAVR